MRSSACVGLALLVAAGCMGSEPEQIEGVSRAIINGTAITNRPWAVAVYRAGSSGSAGLCTGTVIGDYAILTAKHCVFDDSSGRWRAVPASDLTVIVGYDLTDAAGIMDRSSVYEIRTTPGSDVDRDINDGNDIAVLLLPAPIGVGRRRPSNRAPARGENVTIVGFGRTMSGTAVDGDSGVKYVGNARVNRVGGRIVESTGASWTCQGDSGGPLLADSDNRILGVTSFGIGGCTVSNSFYSRVDIHLGLINDALSWAPPCDPSPEVCDGVDNDCNGIEDEGCTGLGDACGSDDECSDGRCEPVGAGRVCVRECDPRTSIPMCPFGFHCEAVACATGRCVEAGAGAGADGAECAEHADCRSYGCSDVGGTMRCGRQCDPDGDPCAAGNVCETFDDTCGSCIPLELSTAPRSFGVECEDDSMCRSGDCGDEGFCTRACSVADPCASGFHCRGGVCVGGDLGGPGSGCLSVEDCSSVAPECVHVEGDSICVAPCDEMGMCPLGFECGPTDAGDRCVPPGLAFGAECTANPECRSGVCVGFCTRLCASDLECPEDYECREAGEASGCFLAPVPPPSRSGGCSISAARGGLLGSLPLALLAVVLLWRRRSRG